MSCNGCRVLRKGCSENCILRPCLQWIESPEAQGHATVFVAKFFGRAGLMSSISNVPEHQRPALFRSLLFEAAGRTVNPVSGAVGLLGTGEWRVCQAAVETVLRGGALRPLEEVNDVAGRVDMFRTKKECCTNVQKRRGMYDYPVPVKVNQLADLDLSLTPGLKNINKGKMVFSSGVAEGENSEESGTSTCLQSGGFGGVLNGPQRRREELMLLNLFR